MNNYNNYNLKLVNTKSNIKFDNYVNFYILAYLNKNKINDCINKMRSNLSYTYLKKPNTLHITLMEIIFNKDHPLFNKIFHSLKNMQFQMPDITLYLSNYDIKGLSDKKFFTIDCKVINGNITIFRKYIYKTIENIINKRTLKYFKDANYVYYQVDNIILYCIPLHSYGNKIWQPHISIINSSNTNVKIQKYLLNYDINSIKSLLKTNCLNKQLSLIKSAKLKMSFSLLKSQDIYKKKYLKYKSKYLKYESKYLIN